MGEPPCILYLIGPHTNKLNSPQEKAFHCFLLYNLWSKLEDGLYKSRCEKLIWWSLGTDALKIYGCGMIWGCCIMWSFGHANQNSLVSVQQGNISGSHGCSLCSGPSFCAKELHAFNSSSFSHNLSSVLMFAVVTLLGCQSLPPVVVSMEWSPLNAGKHPNGR